MALKIDDAVKRTGIDTDIDEGVLVLGSDGTNPQPISVNSSGEISANVTTIEPFLASYGVDALAIATYYYPSATGFDLDGYKDVSITGILTSTGATILTVEVINAVGGTWTDITMGGYNPVTNATGAASITKADTNFALDFDNLNKAFVRIKLDVGHATNTNEIDFRAI